MYNCAKFCHMITIQAATILALCCDQRSPCKYPDLQYFPDIFLDYKVFLHSSDASSKPTVYSSLSQQYIVVTYKTDHFVWFIMMTTRCPYFNDALSALELVCHKEVIASLGRGKIS